MPLWVRAEVKDTQLEAFKPDCGVAGEVARLSGMPWRAILEPPGDP